MIGQPFDDLAAQQRSLHDLAAVLRLHPDIHHTQRLDMHQRSHLAEAVAATHLDVQALLRVTVVGQAHIHLQSPLGTLLPQVLIHLHGPAGDTARTGTDQHVQGRSAPFQRLRRLFVHGVEALPCQLAHSAASFPRMASNSASAVSGVILAYTSPSTVITGARPQAPRQATVSSVNTPSALVLRLPSSFRYS